MNIPERRHSALVALTSSGIFGVIYLFWTPATSDLAAQTARAHVASHAGITTWWTGWFGGLSLPSYSALSPALMAWLGVAACGSLCVLLTSLAASVLLREAPRPAFGTLALSIAAMANVVDGRTTFAIGVTFAMWALAALRFHALATTALSVLSFLGSPLAGLFLGFVLLAVAKTFPRYRVRSLIAASFLGALAVGMQIFFPGTGTMPFSIWAALSAAVGGVAAFVVIANEAIRMTIVLTFCGLAVFAVVPGAVGDNLTRLFWIGAFPAVVAYGQLPDGHRRRRLVAAAVLAVVWPAWDVGSQVAKSFDQSVTAGYYAPLASELHTQRDLAGTGALGQRVEVLDVATHWDSAYLTDFTLARGWDRQADLAENPIFYQDEPLTPAKYRTWLDELAVGWVAVPAADLDYASKAEGQLIQVGLPYLAPTWANHDWRLYRVRAPSSLVERAAIQRVDSDVIQFDVPAAGTFKSRIRYSPYLALRRTDPASSQDACVQDDSGWARLRIPTGGRYELTTTFNPLSRFRAGARRCTG